MDKKDIFVLYGTNPKEMAKQLLKEVNLEKLLSERFGQNKKIRIGLKPNLVVARPACEGATTHPELAEGVIEYLQEKGYYAITILEGSWVGEQTKKAFSACGYEKLAKKYSVALLDTQKDTSILCDCSKMNLNICKSVFSIDFMINLPVLKGHCQTKITCALKNNKGLIPNSEKRKFHTLGLHKPIAHLNTKIPNDFIIVDGICGDLDFEEGGNPVPMNRLIAALDPVLCDAYVCELLGYQVEEIPYIFLASKLLVGNSDTSCANITELNKPKNTAKSISFTRKLESLSKNVQSESACSACYASLLYALSRLEKENIHIKIPICIGQGFKEKTGQLGVGNCTSQFQSFIKGCPPKAIDIYQSLLELKK